ncbi:MAG: DUF2007 domain-containing protein [Bacillota bacterium]|jgi:hypothetical protein|nr:glutamate decarboxylase [Bacillota bacterium]HOB90731.1 DUF2007 domain-containing protein [Bacillota bacterium]HPZ54088.1 DUF2007 domain-containing protein [Bacillota bacterium]HQD18162.1 DUF2007 domain-containing protein [Bacillota bacterium]
MWTVVHVALDDVNAQQVRSVLEAEGIMVRLRPMGGSSQGESGSIEVLVLESEAEEAQQVLDEKL